ncbi:hypothetical protein Trydic_g9746 [Trypoxylus dichotomus]
MGMFQQSDNVYAVLENVTALTTLFQAEVKSIILILYKDDFLSGIAILKKFWRTNMFGKQANEQICNYGDFIKKVLTVFRLVVGISGTLYLIKPLLEKYRMLPMTYYISCDLENDICYTLYYVLQSVTLYSQLITLLGFDGVFFILFMASYAELEQIKYALCALEINEKVEGDDEEVLKRTAALIEHHSLVLDFPPSTGAFLKGGPYGLSALTQIFIYSAIGEKIAEQTEIISDVGYDTNWSLNYQPKFRKMLLMIMQRSQKRSQITAGGVWNLNMSTFAAILRGSMSLLAFMQTVYGDKKAAV